MTVRCVSQSRGPKNFSSGGRRWIRYGVRDYPSLETLHGALTDSGLSIHTTPLFGRIPFNSYLLIARREPTPA
ncbi:MAG: hypothetical protein WCB49_05315 [Gammaproteobacteria bacterium]